MSAARQSKNRNLATNPAINTYGKKYRKTYKKAPAANRRNVKALQKRVPYATPRGELAVPIPECTRHYLNAICDPWDTPAGVCLPADMFPLPSQKVKVVSRGNFQLGTSGYGFIGLGPCSTSDTPGISYSTSTSVMTPTTLLSAVTNKGTTGFSKLPYTFADVETNNLAQARIVACGIRIRYNGTEDARQGTMVAFEEQDHSALNVYSFSTLQNE
jgi:hypothetical protein